MPAKPGHRFVQLVCHSSPSSTSRRPWLDGPGRAVTNALPSGRRAPIGKTSWSPSTVVRDGPPSISLQPASSAAPTLPSPRGGGKKLMGPPPPPPPNGGGEK